MNKYLSLFRMKFCTQLQYRGAAIAGMVTQFVWGAMEILVFRAFYQADQTAFPMTFQATVSYIWLQQAFLAFFMAFCMENEPLQMIIRGDIAYELCRPVHIFDLWFFRSLGHRLASGLMRCVPIILFSLLLPSPYGLRLPTNWMTSLSFAIGMILGILVTVTLCMLIYILAFFTISPLGLRMCYFSIAELLSGAIVPIPFFPEQLRGIVSILPFASMQNVPLRIYSGDLIGRSMVQALVLQLIWFVTLLIVGRCLSFLAIKKVTVQGG